MLQGFDLIRLAQVFVTQQGDRQVAILPLNFATPEYLKQNPRMCRSLGSHWNRLRSTLQRFRNRLEGQTNSFAYVKLEESGRVAQLAEQCPFKSCRKVKSES
jgi:hypothetical protein